MVETSKMYMKNVNYVYSSWFAVYCANQCTFAKPIISESEPDYENKTTRFNSDKGVVVCHREATFGRIMWKIKSTEVDIILFSLLLFNFIFKTFFF